jgi:hypothetical protein
MTDAIEYGGIGFTIDHNFIVDTQGNGVHTGAAYKSSICNNFVYNCMIRGEANGHADGAIIQSDTIYDSLVCDNYIEKCNGYCAITYVSSNNYGVTFTGNYVKDTLTALGTGRPCIEIKNAAYAGVVDEINGRITISGNVIINGGSIVLGTGDRPLSVDANGDPVSGMYAPVVTGNYLERTGVFIGNCQGAVVSGNTFFILPTPGNTSLSGLTDDSHLCVYTPSTDVVISGNNFVDSGLSQTRPCIRVVSDSSRITVEGNSFNGYAVAVTNGADSARSDDLRVVGNTIRNCYLQAFYHGGSSAGIAGGERFEFSRNLVIGDSGTFQSNLIGNLGPGSSIIGNRFAIDFTVAAVNIIAFQLPSAAGRPGCVVAHNRFDISISGAAVGANLYAVSAGGAMNFVEYNYATAAAAYFASAATLTNNRNFP